MSGYSAGSVLWQHQNGNKVLLGADGIVYIGDDTGAQELVQKSFLEDKWNILMDILAAASLILGVPPITFTALKFNSLLPTDVTSKVKGA